MLTLNGKDLDNTIEHELKSDSVHGFNVHINFKHGTPYHKDNPEGVKYYNVTEVHWMFESMLGHRKMVAIESDIHHTGCTKEIAEIESLTITDARKLEKDLYGNRYND